MGDTGFNLQPTGNSAIELKSFWNTFTYRHFKKGCVANLKFCGGIYIQLHSYLCPPFSLVCVGYECDPGDRAQEFRTVGGNSGELTSNSGITLAHILEEMTLKWVEK